MILHAPSIKALQTLIDICFKFTGENDILYNETKTQCMSFWPRSYTQSVLPLVALGTSSLKFGVEAVYLVYIIRSNLIDDSDIYQQVRKPNTVGNVLILKFFSCSEKMKCELFRTYCSALYCCSFWCSYNLVKYR